MRSYPVLLSTLAASLFLLNCGQSAAPKQAAKESSARVVQTSSAPVGSELRPGSFHTEPVVERPTPTNVVTAPGKVEANSNRISRVTPPVSGRVLQVLVRFGDAVKGGQPIAILESPESDAAVSEAQQAEASLNQAKSSLAKAEADLERIRDLYENKAVARKELLGAENQQVQASSEVKHAAAALQRTLRRLQILDLSKDEFGQKIVVRAPLSGKVLEVNVAPGEFRNDPTQPLMTIADLSSVWVTADVPESSIRFIQRGERVEIELTAYPGERFSGRVTQIADIVNPDTRTIQVRAELANSNGNLRPDMFGQIRHIDAIQPMPTIPRSALVRVSGKSVVYVESASGAYVKREVQTGEPFDEYIPIVSGLHTGERVVVDGAMLLTRK